MFCFNTSRPCLIAMLTALGLAFAAAPVSVQAQDEKPAATQKDDAQVELEKKLADYLSGTKWTGKFSLDGTDKIREEYYEILSAEKSEFGDNWNLVARIKYGGKDRVLPLPPIEIKFAGKTPVITVDRVTFPGFGTFDARVVIRGGKYAGTWAHIGDGQDVGGHLFGTIEKMTEQEMNESKEKKDQ